MKATQIAFAAAACGVLAACASTGAADSVSTGQDRLADRAAITAAYADMASALSECDYDRYATHVRPGAHVWYATEAEPSREDITDQATRDGCERGQMSFETVRLDFVSSGTAIMHGEATFLDPATGPSHARFTETWTRQGGAWLLAGGMAMWSEESGDYDASDEARAEAAEAAEE